MDYIKIIKRGLQNLNRNYQLLFIQMATLILAFILFLLMVGIPMVIVFTNMGLELPKKGLSGLIEIIIQNLSFYKTFVLILIMSILTYLLVSSLLFVYMMAGTCGILMNSIKNGEAFSWKHFTEQGKGLFGSFLRIFIVGTLLFLFISFFAGLISGITKVLLPEKRDFLGNFYTNLLNLLLLVFTLLLIILFMATLTYGAGILIIKRQGALNSLKDSLNFILKKPEALFFFFIITLTGIILTVLTGSISLLLKGFSFVLYQLILSFVQIYINLAIISSSFAYLTKEQKENSGDQTRAGRF